MFGVCATVKRTRSLDTPSNVTNPLQPFDDNVFDNGPYNQKENFASDDNLLWLDNECCHDIVQENYPVKQSCDLVNSCHGNVAWRSSGIKKSVELFNSPYMVNDNSSAVMCSNKKRKTVSASNAITMVTNISGNTTKNRPSINNKYRNQVSILVVSWTVLAYYITIVTHHYTINGRMSAVCQPT